MIAIIDYKMGNIKSLENAIDFLGCTSCVTNQAEKILNADKIILPGVGAFNIAMKNLKIFKIIEPLTKAVFEKKIPILGICLGMQLFATHGEENGLTDGLGWINGTVKRFSFNDEKIRIPHIGFNSVDFENRSPNLFEGLTKEADFYFVHNYHMICENNSDASSWTQYGERFVSSIQKQNIFGTQFHPEKSQSNGLKLLKNFISLPRDSTLC
jgi:glutamine amidotransferase